MAGYTYETFRTAIQTLCASQSLDQPFDTIFPSAIIYAEQRIYRELDLISTVIEVTPVTTLVTAQRRVELPHTIVAINSISILTPAGSNALTGTRIPLAPVTQDVLNMLWPGNVVTGVPKMFAMLDQWTIMLGASPDDAYATEILATTRPAELSASNATTFLSERLPDLLIAAAMVFMSGYMRNFGAQASDPAQAVSWEAQYEKLKASATTEEERKYFWGSSWSSQPISTTAQPQRG